jgi:5-methylcytosine-specific restriction protein B
LNLVENEKVKFRIEKENLIQLLCFTFSFNTKIYKKDPIKLDLDWFDKYMKLIQNHFQTSSEFIFDVKKQSQDRYYFISLEQSSGLNIRDIFIQDHIRLVFFDSTPKLIKIEFSNLKYSEESSPIVEESQSEFLKKENLKTPLNRIIYGPPGTGKTRKIQLNHLAGKDVTNSKFITFHQSYSYEEFIEGLKPSLAREKIVLFNSSILSQFVEIVFRELIKEISLDKILNLSITKQSSIEAIKYTSYSIEEYFGASVIFGAFDSEQPRENLQSGKNNTSRFYYDKLFVKDEKYFYLSNQWYGNGNYELHINNLIPFVKSITDGLLTVENRNGVYFLIKEINSSNVIYNIQKGVFYDACESAAMLAGYDSLVDCLEDSRESRTVKMNRAISNNNVFIMCIDEINRANISSVFGDLITLIESNKRLGSQEEMSAILPYSKEKFGVPLNLQIIGTMNTADRSITLLDSALRRRFHFDEILPNPDVLDGIVIDGIVVKELLKKINKRIVYFLGKDQSIGHSYFLGLNNSTNPKRELLSIFWNNVIPLLEEYFYNDTSKIRLVLGEGNKNAEISFYIKDEESDIEQLFGNLEDDLDLDEQSSSFVRNDSLFNLSITGEEAEINADIFVKIYK